MFLPPRRRRARATLRLTRGFWRESRAYKYTRTHEKRHRDGDTSRCNRLSFNVSDRRIVTRSLFHVRTFAPENQLDLLVPFRETALQP